MKHLVEVYFDLEVKIDEVLGKDKIKVSHKLKDEYKKLRKNGYFVDSVGDISPSDHTVNSAFKFEDVKL